MGVGGNIFGVRGGIEEELNVVFFSGARRSIILFTGMSEIWSVSERDGGRNDSRHGALLSLFFHGYKLCGRYKWLQGRV